MSSQRDVDPAGEWVTMYCVEVVQPIGTFYVGVVDSGELEDIAYADIRRMIDRAPRAVEEFSGIQRPLSESRVEEIAQYVTTVDASFPTGIIVHVEPDDAEYANGVMRIRRKSETAKILDGQHRIAGLRGYKGQKFQLNVTIFVGMDAEEQALLFATINLKQTRVKKSLAYDLFDFAEKRSPQKTSHHVVRTLNSTAGSPFYRRIMILGSATSGRKEIATQAAIVDRLLPLISDDPMRDRDALKRGRSLPSPPANRARKLIFRELFASNRDAEIARNVWNVFAAAQQRWPKAWQSDGGGIVLNRTTGIDALMRFLQLVYPRAQKEKEVVRSDSFLEILKRVQLTDEEINRDRFVPGSAGQGALYRVLAEAAGYEE